MYLRFLIKLYLYHMCYKYKIEVNKYQYNRYEKINELINVDVSQ